MSERYEEELGEDGERLLHRFANLESGPGEKQVNDVVNLAKALAHPQRLKLLAAIVKKKYVCVNWWE